MRRIAGIALAVVGIIIAIVGLAMVTVWRPGGTVATTVRNLDTSYVATRAGVLDLVSSKVTIAVSSSDDAEITLALGYSDDVAAWADGTSVTDVTGLSDWSTFSTESREATVEDVPSLADSDMWLETKTGTGKIEVSYDVVERGEISLIAQSSTGKAPDLTLTWQKNGSNEATLPLIFIGVILAAIGALIFALDQHERKREAERLAARQHRAARRASRAAAETAVLAKFDGDIAASSREIQTAATGHAFGAGVLFASPRAQELRERELTDEARLIIDKPDEAPEEQNEPAADAPESVDTVETVADTSDDDVATPTSGETAGESTTTVRQSPWRERWASFSRTDESTETTADQAEDHEADTDESDDDKNTGESDSAETATNESSTDDEAAGEATEETHA
ncbi:hypothetical protein I6E29_04925 [Arcanobacterium haemolyticum]|nr:hypothetical protein [Arcanobacterium haemolyticum]